MKFLNQLKTIINTGQSRSVILTGNIYDLFFDGNCWVPLMQLLQKKCKVERNEGQKGITQICWQINRPIEVIEDKQLDELHRCWRQLHKDEKPLKVRLTETQDNSVYALELLRQITECARFANCSNNLLIMIESADMMLPDSPIANMMMHDRKRVNIVQDWFGDPKFVSGHDTVILFAESRSNLHQRVARLPQVASIEVPLPDIDQRVKFIEWFNTVGNCVAEVQTLAENTSGLSLHAVHQLLRSGDFSPENLTNKVEEYMAGQLGEGVIEFKRPTHTLDDVIGFSRVKAFIKEELIPGFRNNGKDGISGVLVGGPIGSGKTFLCEATASEVGCPVILLKNIRSKWYGETDQIFERLRRLLETFHKIMIFVDEADAMFGDISSDQETERRLTGQIQQMMSDPALRGRVIWFLMTARVHRLSPDIRRPGRMDLIIPILDPEGDDLEAFIKWAFGSLVEQDKSHSFKSWLSGSSSARFAMIRSRIKAKGCQTVDEARAIIYDMIEPDIGDTRLYQTLQAKMNCTRRSLLVDPDMKLDEFINLKMRWRDEIVRLERNGIR